jgi:hypothetical protein
MAKPNWTVTTEPSQAKPRQARGGEEGGEGVAGPRQTHASHGKLGRECTEPGHAKPSQVRSACVGEEEELEEE